MMKFETLEEEASQLDYNLAAFASSTGLSRDIFALPESIQVRAKSKSYFKQLQEAFVSRSERMAVIQRGWRFYTVAKLQGGIVLPHFGSVNWLEIAEPTDTQEQSGQGGVVSARFVYDDLVRLKTIFRNVGLVSGGGEGSVEVPVLGPQMVEFTEIFTDERLAHQLKNREAIEVKLHD